MWSEKKKLKIYFLKNLPIVLLYLFLQTIKVCRILKITSQEASEWFTIQITWFFFTIFIVKKTKISQEKYIFIDFKSFFE